jgi:sugar phosphate isomerase/epimerase
MKLGVDIYSLRLQGWNAFQHLEYAKKIGLNIVHFSDLEPFESLDDDYLVKVKAKADELGMLIEAGMGSICPTSNTFSDARGSAVDQLKEMLHIAQVLGSPVVRCFLGSNADRHSELPLEAHIENTVATCKAVRSMAMDMGIKIAVENHAGDMQARELKGLIEAAGPEYVGACIDPGNACWVSESPFVTLEHLAPYVVTSHARDTAVWSHPRGAAVQWVAMGDGTVGIDKWAEEYKLKCPNAPFTMEIITGGPARVLNYMEPEYWKAYPNTPAAEFARWEKHVREGQPFMGPMITVRGGSDMPDEYRAALVVQQRIDLERSVAYCREKLGIGE